MKTNLPNDIKIEKTILGAFLNDSSAPITFIQQIKPEMFFDESCKDAIIAIESLIKKNIGIDILTVSKESRALGLSCTMIFINECYNLIVSTQNLQSYISTLKELYVRRELVHFANKSLAEAINLSIDPLQLMAKVQSQLSTAVDNLVVKPIDELSKLSNERIIDLLDTKKEKKIKGIPSGFVSIDETMGGDFKNGSLIILAGRPGMGKTTFALNIARNMACFQNASGVVFSLEMTKDQLVDKFIAAESGVDSRNIDQNKVHDLDIMPLQEASIRLGNTNVFLDDSSGLTPMILRSKATNLKIKHDIKFIVVDYLQLMQDDNRKGKSREQEVSEISRSLKLIAKDLQIPLIALSQLSRSCESRTNKRPMLSDLRESGSIEQDADVVMFVYRPEYYNEMFDANGNSLTNKAEIIFAKNRFGEVKFTTIDCDLSKSKFMDLNNKTNFEQPSINSFPKDVISQEFVF
jgi:replicative DNA helicase